MIKAQTELTVKSAKLTELDTELEGVGTNPSKVKEYEVAPGDAVQVTVICVLVLVCVIEVTAAEAVDIFTEEEAVVPYGFTVVMIKAYVLFAIRPVKVAGLDVEVDGVAAAPSKVKVYEVAPSDAVQATVI